MKYSKTTKNLALIVAIILTIFFIDKLFFAPERDKNSRINEAIFTRFREIESYCSSYVQSETVNQRELEKCNEVVNMQEYCGEWSTTNEVPNDCYADKYYKDLQSLGFDLPEFYNKEIE